MLMLAVTTGLTLALADRWTKAFIASRFTLGAERRLLPGVRLRYVRHRLNPTVVDEQRSRLVALLIAAASALVWISTQTPLWQTPSAQAGLALAIVGATSNAWDRIQHHAFVDFICIGRWPPFNLADAGICAGVLIALAELF